MTVVEKIKIHVLCRMVFSFFGNRAVYEILTYLLIYLLNIAESFLRS